MSKIAVTEWRPTQFDPPLNCILQLRDDQQEWVVLSASPPNASLNRKWVRLSARRGEQVALHRVRHWLIGAIDIIIGSPLQKKENENVEPAELL